MILYDLRNCIKLSDFGIEIPVSPDKTGKILDYLFNHPVLSNFIDNLTINKIDENITREDLLRVHSREYTDRLFSDGLEQEIIRAYELIDNNGNYRRYNPQNAVLPLASLFSNQLKKVAGTLQCCKIALKTGFCLYFGGGSHHAKKDYGEGFCILNDIVIAIRNLQANKLVNRVWVIDVDAHKGDGTAALTYGDDSVRTLSIHMARGWPLDSDMYKSGELNPSFIPSDIDIPVLSGEEDRYSEKLREGLNKIQSFSVPQLAVIVLGADPYEKDELPSTTGLKLSLPQMKERDLLIYEFFKTRKVPQAYLMAGGYGIDSWRVYAQFLEYVLLDQNSYNKNNRTNKIKV